MRMNEAASMQLQVKAFAITIALVRAARGMTTSVMKQSILSSAAASSCGLRNGATRRFAPTGGPDSVGGYVSFS